MITLQLYINHNVVAIILNTVFNNNCEGITSGYVLM